MAKGTKNQELATKTNTLPVAADQHLDEWGPPPQVSQKDTIVSKIHLMQGLSKKVVARQAQIGELRDSVTNELYGDIQTPMEFIPFHMQNTWIESEWVADANGRSGSFEYKRTIPVTPENDNLPYESEDGTTKRTRTMNFFVLLPGEVAAGTEIPRIMSFAVTSRRGGQKLATQMFVTNRVQNKAPAAMVMKLSVTLDSNDKGTFAVKDCEPSRPASQAELDSALKWFRVVKGPNNLKVDEGDSDDTQEVGDTGNF